MIEVSLSKGLVALIDDEDAKLVSKYTWCATVNGSGLTKWTYAVTNIVKPDGRRTMLRMHRLIMGARRGQQVDHKNHNGLDNRRANLRFCTNAQNQGNSRSLSGYKGVGWHSQKGRWRAYIMINGKNKHLGLFLDPWDAAQAYNQAASAAWGSFANLNVRIHGKVA